MTDNSIVARRNGESDIQYHKRLVYGKLVDKTLSDWDYSELAELVYGKRYAPDVARRLMYGSRFTLGLIERSAENDSRSDPAADIDSRILELKKERQKFFDQRREYNKSVTSDSRREHLYDSLEDAAKNLRQTVGAVFSEEPACAKQDPVSENEAILVFSDWHYGMKANNLFNVYNTDICKSRVKTVVDAASKRLLMHGCRRLHIVVLGDLFHGAIHTGVRVAAEELACEQLMQSSEILAQAIGKLSNYAEETIVYTTYGNHGRTVQNKNDSIHRDNMERIVPWWLKERLSDNSRIHIAADSGCEFLFIDAAGHEFCAAHGDLDSVKRAPELLHTLMHKQLGRDIDYILLGDKHHREMFDELGITAEICGSLCGTDDYANDLRKYSLPSQLLLIVNRECGVDAEYRLRC